MNTLRSEITAALRDLSSDNDGNATARFRFPAGFTGFQGHFPGQPVLPGICLIQAVLAMYDALHATRARLQEVVNAKFIAPASCDQNLTITLQQRAENEGRKRIKASIQRDRDRIATLDIRITHST